MAEEHTQRRLAAILAADVVGYSRLMEADEAGTMAMLKARRKQVLEPLVARLQGRVFKITGDGVLIEFSSAVHAVQCALELQHAMAAANADLPEARRIVLRIGVNLGDVLVEGSDLYGDGVNIAARLEAIAEPGGILVSGTAYDHVGTKVETGFDDLGAQTLKNIAQPVRTYRVTGAPAVAVTAINTISDKPCIAVLPFANMSGDPEQQYFSDGITEDIITALSRFHTLYVIARNSSFQYRGQAIDVKRVGRELCVQYVVEGSIRKIGHRIRISAQLVDATTGNHLWAERYDRDTQDLFSIQDEVVAMIVARAAGQVGVAGTARARRKPTVSLAAYDCLLRFIEELSRDGAEHLRLAHNLAQQAISLDPNFAQAHAALAFALLYFYWAEAYGAHLPAARLESALGSAEKAVALDSSDAFCHRTLAVIHLERKSFALAKYHLEAATQLNPNDIKLMANRGQFEVFAGEPTAALELLDQAKRLDPQLFVWYWQVRGLALYQLRSYADAAVAFEQLSPAPASTVRYRAACYAQLGRLNEAQAKATEALKREPGFTLSRYAQIEPYQSRAALDHIIEGLRKAGLPE
jgi:TolB-like protein/tetratricopeptide (TPR) repeat protein